MNLTDRKLIIHIGLAVLGIGVLLRGWDDIVSIAGALLTASAPLLVGGAIAYIVNILMSFLSRHLLPHNNSDIVTLLRTPICLLVSFLMIVTFVIMTISLVVPALSESFEVIGSRVSDIAAWLKTYEPAHPLINAINQAVSGDVLDMLSRLDVTAFLKQGAGDIMGPITEQLMLVVTSAVTFFFGLLFSVWLLLDKTLVARQVRRLLGSYLGERHYGQLVHVVSTLDHCYHGYIVRQCAEAAMLGIVSAILLFLFDFPYVLGISSLVMFASFIPVVGIPIGFFVGSFLVLTDSPLFGIIYLVVMFISQGIIETFAMPHVGDQAILLSPVWITVAVTLGGGLFGFAGMVGATPLAAAIYQLLQFDVARRQRERDAKEVEPAPDAA